MPQYPVPSLNSILVGGIPLVLSLESYDGTILPGDLVQFRSGTCLIEPGENDGTEIVGVADISVQSSATPGAGGSRTSAYGAGQQVRVLRGPITCMLRLAASEDIHCGEFLQPAASGEVKAWICNTDFDCQRIAQSLQAPTVVTVMQWIMVALERFG